MRQSRLSVALGTSALICCICSSAVAKTWTASESAALFGTLNQYSLSYTYGSDLAAMACGPSSTTNSLVFLQNAFPATYGTSLISAAGHDMDHDGTYTTYDDWIYTAGGLVANPTYMNTTSADGTWHDNLIMGAYRYIEHQLPGQTTYSAVDYWCPTYWGNTPTTYPPPSWVQSGYPTWSYLYNGLNTGLVEQVLLSYVNGGGHFVTLTSMSWDDQSNSGTLAFMNSLTGSVTTTNIRLSSGVLYTDFGGTNGSYIGEALNISPVPEPTSALLLVVGTTLMLTRRQRLSHH